MMTNAMKYNKKGWEKMNKGSRKKHYGAYNVRSKIITILTGILVPLLLLYLYIAYYYHTHFYNNTIINGFDASNMTLSEAEDAITAEVKAYQLSLEERNGITDTISGKDIELHTVFKDSISDMLGSQKVLTWPVSLLRSHELEIDTMLEYDEALLAETINKLSCFTEANNIAPENAKISEYGKNGYEIIPEKAGAKVIEEKLYAAIQNAINTLDSSISLEEEGCYLEPEITSNNKKLIKALTKMNKIAGAEITYEFGDTTEILDGSKISEWLSVDEEFHVDFDTTGVKEYVDYIGKTYNSFGNVRTFKTSYGKTIKVKGGDYGWWLNRPEEVKELTKLIEDGEKVKKDPVYFQTAQQYGKDDIGDTYVEVNLSAQHLFFYKDGKKILETDFVSGNVSKDYGTPVGTYPIQYKENDAVLVGEDYETPVKYWMPFNKNIGFHDASWRSEFGKDIFLTKGSHGCINMPPAAAKKMFKYIKRGVAVVVYKLPGTENYDVKEKTEESKKTDNTEKTEKTETETE